MDVPFVFGRIADEANFIDRDAERARLGGCFTSLVNTVVISPRRWGKTSLVHKVAKDVMAADSRVRVVMIDLFNVRSEADFYAKLTRAVLAATMSKLEEWVATAREFLGHLRPTVSLSPDPTQDVAVGLDWDLVERDPDEVLDLAEKIAAKKKLRLVICIDEFQAVADLPNAGALQRKLRSHWQQHQSVCYCLYGSKRHMLMDIFSNPDLPFYRFGDIITLGKIDNAIWGEFIAGRFKATGKAITANNGCRLASLVDNHSYYVQQLAQQAWFRTGDVCTVEIIDAALADLKDQLSLLFVGLASSLSRRQLNFLRAVLDEREELTSQETLKRYDLGTSGNVVRIKDALVNREIIDITAGGVQILDPIFAHWLRTDYFDTPTK